MKDSGVNVVGLSSSKPKGKTNWKIIGAIIGIIVLAVGVIAGILLVRQNQDIREQASGNCDDPGTIVQCPRSDGALVSCTPPNSDGNAQISLCDSAGRVEVCGGAEYCCPSAGGAWTTNMTLCPACNITPPTSLASQQITSTTAKLSWTPGTGGVIRLWVSTNADPLTCIRGTTSATCIVSDQELAATVDEFDLTNLLPNTKYYWRAMTWKQSGCDAGTQVFNFTTTSSGATATATSSSTATATATATSTSSSGTGGSGNKTATPTATSKSTATSKATATSKSTATAFPVPETGAEWPTVIGAGFGVIMILVSLALAL